MNYLPRKPPFCTPNPAPSHITHHIRHHKPPRSLLLDDNTYTASTLAIELAASSIAAYLAAAWPTRPRGSSDSTLIEVRPSPVSGRGVFAKNRIPKGTILGRYPGRLRTVGEMIKKSEAAPGIDFSTYCFQTRSGCYLDPTDWSGEPSKYPQPGLPWLLPIDITLSYVNEPPKHSPGVNVTVEDDPDDVENGIIFVAAENISIGSELFVDYGLHYDRSKYNE